MSLAFELEELNANTARHILGDADPSRGIRNAGSDLPFAQALREFVKNGLLNGASRVWTTVMPYAGALKLAFVDDGTGFTPTGLRDLLGQMNASGIEQHGSERYGVGAKLAGLSKSPLGLEYWTVQPGADTGVRARLGINGSRFEWLPLTTDGAGQEIRFAEITAAEFHAQCKLAKLRHAPKHGTIVIMLGESPEHDNYIQPELSGAVHNGKWALTYLSDRFWTLPEGVVLHGAASRNIHDRRWENRTTPGGKEIIEEVTYLKTHFWSVDIEGAGIRATASLYVPDRELIQESSWRHRDGATLRTRVIAVQDGEAYVDFTGNKALTILRDFSLSPLMGKAVLVIEPDADQVRPIQARTSLLCTNGAELPWGEWALDFSEKIPETLDALLSASVDSDGARSARREALAAKLSKLPGLLRFKGICAGAGTTAAPDPNGTTDLPDGGDLYLPGGNGAHNTGAGSTDAGQGELPQLREPGAGGAGNGPGGNANAATVAKPHGPGGTTTAGPAVPDLPEVEPITNAHSDETVDKIGFYDTKTDTLFVNHDFPGIKNLADQLYTEALTKRAGRPKRRLADEAKRLAVEQVTVTLLEAIVRLRELVKASDAWTDDALKAVTTPDALSLAALPVLSSMSDLRRNMSNV